tara:strand:+ start:42 stop:506 length:465 start_codon:yes stop_codon:yes gene_type:complete
MAKQLYNWGKVKAGDIISFRYKSKDDTAKLTTLLVLNQRLKFKKKNGQTNFHLVGLKLEESGTIPIIKNKPVLVQLLETVGTIEVVDKDNELYRLQIDGVGTQGVNRRTYDTLRRKLKQFSVYRTYDYEKARQSPVFLEPISIPKELLRALDED